MAAPGAQTERMWRAPVVCAVVLLTFLALFLRTHRTNVPFHSGDYASMPYMVAHWYGVSWIIAHIHGPLLPAIDWLFAKTAVTIGLTMNEMMWRLPLALVGTFHVVVTYLLMRRLGVKAWPAVLAGAMTAALPLLTSDARYPWGYETLAVCIGSLTIWAWLRDLDRPTRFGRWLAGGLLGLYLLSHLVIHAVPVVVVTAVFLAIGPRAGLKRLLQPAAILPVLAAAACTLYSYFALDGGIFGRIARHVGHGTLNAGAFTWAEALELGNQLVGPIWLAWCAAAIVVGLVSLSRRDRRGLPALWAVVYAAPLMLLLNVNNIGRPAVYQVQWVYAASLAGCILLETLADAVKGWKPAPRLACRVTLGSFGLLMFSVQLLGSASNLFTADRWPRLTGTVDYGRAVADPGFKAAGWYIRTQVPSDAVILATHNRTGMEYPTAVYYTGRHVAAAEDTTDEQERLLIDAVLAEIDVAIVEPRFLAKFNEASGFVVPVRVLREGRPILYVAARTGLTIPTIELDVADANTRFDRVCPLRRIPTAIQQLPRTAAVNQRILALLRETDPNEAQHAQAAAGEGE